MAFQSQQQQSGLLCRRRRSSVAATVLHNNTVAAAAALKRRCSLRGRLARNSNINTTINLGDEHASQHMHTSASANSLAAISSRDDGMEEALQQLSEQVDSDVDLLQHLEDDFRADLERISQGLEGVLNQNPTTTTTTTTTTRDSIAHIHLGQLLNLSANFSFNDNNDNVDNYDDTGVDDLFSNTAYDGDDLSSDVAGGSIGDDHDNNHPEQIQEMQQMLELVDMEFIMERERQKYAVKQQQKQQKYQTADSYLDDDETIISEIDEDESEHDDFKNGPNDATNNVSPSSKPTETQYTSLSPEPPKSTSSSTRTTPSSPASSSFLPISLSRIFQRSKSLFSDSLFFSTHHASNSKTQTQQSTSSSPVSEHIHSKSAIHDRNTQSATTETPNSNSNDNNAQIWMTPTRTPITNPCDIAPPNNNNSNSSNKRKVWNRKVFWVGLVAPPLLSIVVLGAVQLRDNRESSLSSTEGTNTSIFQYREWLDMAMSLYDGGSGAG